MTTLWERVKTSSKTGFDRTWKALDKVGAPVNKLSEKLGAEAFWPTTLDLEADKAARILKSFCKDGFYAEEEYQPAHGPKQAQKVLKKIPASVIKNAKGLAIFTTMRTGLWVSGAGGSGVLIARQADGSWSPPSGILLHTAGLGFMIGIDIYDCVVVINSEKALEAFYKVRCTLGGEISVAAGPVGAGGVLETEIHKRQAPIFTYMKSRGFYAGVQIDGTIIIERGDENEHFYGQRLPVKDILSGKVRHPPYEVRRLLETVKAAQGDTDYDASILPSEPPPGDYEVDNSNVFGVPNKEDPDPYGVLALEKEGMGVVEAGTKKRASWEQFSYCPSPTSPVHSMCGWKEAEKTFSRRDSWRASIASQSSVGMTRRSSFRRSMEAPLRVSTQIDISTHVEAENPAILTWRNGLDRRSSRSSTAASARKMRDVPEESAVASAVSERRNSSLGVATPYSTPPSTSPSEGGSAASTKASFDIDDAASHKPMLELGNAALVQVLGSGCMPVVAKARLVTMPKRIPPKLPPRNPDRLSMQETAPEEVALPLSPSASTTSSSSVPGAFPDADHFEDALVKGSDILAQDSAVVDETCGEEFQAHTIDNGEASFRRGRESRSSTGSSTWDKIRAFREIDYD